MGLTDKQKLKTYGNYLNEFKIPLIQKIVKEVIVHTPTIYFGAASVEQAEEVMGAPKGALTHVDVVIARIIRTLDKHFDEDVKFKYMSAIELDPIAPELKYLTSLVKQMV